MGQRGLSATQLAFLLGLDPAGPARSTIVGSNNRRHQEAPRPHLLDVLTLS